MQPGQADNGSSTLALLAVSLQIVEREKGNQAAKSLWKGLPRNLIIIKSDGQNLLLLQIAEKTHYYGPSGSIMNMYIVQKLYANQMI